MRTIKIILGFLIVLTVAFFSVGLIVKETHYSAKVEVNKPVDEVFQKLNDIESISSWMPEINSVETKLEKPNKVGSEYIVYLTDNNGNEMTMKDKILAYVPNQKLTHLYEVGDMIKTNDFNFSSDNNSTTVTLEVSCKTNSYIMSCIFPLFKSRLQSIEQEYLVNFKEFVEKQ